MVIIGHWAGLAGWKSAPVKGFGGTKKISGIEETVKIVRFFRASHVFITFSQGKSDFRRLILILKYGQALYQKTKSKRNHNLI